MALSICLPSSDFSLRKSLADGMFSNTLRKDLFETVDGSYITGNLTSVEAFASNSQAEGTLAFSEATLLISPYPKRVFDPRSGLHVHILNAHKIPSSIDETEGILSDLALKLEEEGIDPTALIKRAWKTGE